MKNALTAAALAALAVAAIALAAPAKTETFNAKLNAKQEVPAPTGVKKQAAGTFTAQLTGTKLRWTLTFRKLSGPAAAAHIHMGARGVAGDVIVPLCGPCKNGAKGTATVTQATIDALKGGTAYVNVHTETNAAGEIRGQIKKVAKKS